MGSIWFLFSPWVDWVSGRMENGANQTETGNLCLLIPTRASASGGPQGFKLANPAPSVWKLRGKHRGSEGTGVQSILRSPQAVVSPVVLNRESAF